MPEYSYQGQSQRGEEIGVLEAQSAAAAAAALRNRGITPIQIRPAAARGRAAQMSLPWHKNHIERADVLMFSRQMHVMTKAGVPIMAALTSLRESSSNEALREVLTDVRDKLESGLALSGCMARHPKVFDPFFLSMVRVGEETGRLEEIFLALFKSIEFEADMRQQVKSALRYPVFVMGAILVALGIVNFFVIPAFAGIFRNAGAQLPIFTRFLMGSSAFLLEYWWMFAGLAAFAGAWFRSWTQTPEGRLAWHRLLLRVPVAGTIVLKASLARFSRSLALALKSGMPVLQAIRIVAETADNAELTRRLASMSFYIERGDTVLRAARSCDVFPPMVLQMIAVGDESGQMDEMMDEVSQMYTTEVQYELKSLAQRIEPILVFAMGVIVLILALGVFLPIWDLGRVSLRR